MKVDLTANVSIVFCENGNMKKKRLIISVSKVILTIALSFVASQISAQSGRPIETPSPSTVPATPAPDEVDDEIKFPVPSQKYEYIAPRGITTFLDAANNAGERGFRLTQILDAPNDKTVNSSAEKAGSTILAGIAQYEGINQYQYGAFLAESYSEPAERLNSLAKDGWHFRDLISVSGGTFNNDSNKGDFSIPTYGNVIIIERIVDGEASPYEYKFLKAGVGLGKNPTTKMQTLLDAETKNGSFAPIATLLSFGAGSKTLIDAYFGVLLVDKKEDAPQKEYRFMRSGGSYGYREDFEKAAQEGFQPEILNTTSAVLSRTPNEKKPLKFYFVITENKKKYPDILNAAFENKIIYDLGRKSVNAETRDFTNSLLLFRENANGEAGKAKYKILNMTVEIPKQYKKNPQEYLKNLANPLETFKQMQAEGYEVIDLYLSDYKNVSILFLRFQV